MRKSSDLAKTGNATVVNTKRSVIKAVSYTHLQQIRGAVVLPHGTGKKVRILVFAKDAKAEEAKAAGADYVGGDELIPKIQNENWFEFDVVVATPDMMGVDVYKRQYQCRERSNQQFDLI